MKGLILKDLYTVRFQIIAGLLIMTYPNLSIYFLYFLGGGMDIGERNEMKDAISILLFGLINLMNICLFSSFVLNTLSVDVKSGWAKLQRTFPLSGSEIVGAKLIASGVVVGLLTVMSLVLNLATALIFRVNVELMLTMPLCIGFYQMMVLAPLFPLAMRIGVKCTEFIYIITEILMLGIVAFLMIKLLGTSLEAVLLRIIFYGGIPLLSAASCTLSFCSGKKAIEKAEL